VTGGPVFIRNIEKGDRISIGRGLPPALVTGHCVRVPISGEWTYVVRYKEDEGYGPERELMDQNPLRRVMRISQAPSPIDWSLPDFDEEPV
jgi:hypothetical protein